MRALGYILLILGTISLFVRHEALVQDGFDLAFREARNLAENQRYTKTDMEAVMTSVASSTAHLYKGTIPFVLIILSGALLLDLAGLRKRRKNKNAEPAAGGNAE